MQEQGAIVLYEDQNHKFVLLGWEEIEEEGVVQVNQYLVIDNQEVALLDPGGAHVFPKVLANLVEIADVDAVKHIFYTHQDPDVVSGITLWMSIAEKAKIYISELWVRFLPHFGIYDKSRVVALPDKGGEIVFSSGNRLEIIPAHFLHSIGNHCVYDPVAKILFSGDIGASVFPPGKKYPMTDDFESHLQYMEGFHKRYITSNKACRKWVDMMLKKEIEIIAPQHGAVMKGDCVRKFLNWFKDLRCGIDIIEDIYGV